MPTPNEKFREARERTPSQVDSTECLTRQELAEAANTWLWEHHGKEFVLTGGYIGKLEQGIIRWPSALYREVFREILKVPTDSELGFLNVRARRAAVKLGKVKRRNLIKTTTVGVGALALGEPRAALPQTSEPTPIPHRVGASDIAQIRSITQEFESWGNAYGGESIRDAAMAQLRWSAGLLDAICPERLRPELHSALGALAESVGFMNVDTGAPEEAAGTYCFALYCAEQAKDWNLRAMVLSSMAEHAVWTGQPDDGLTLAELALVRPDRLTATGRALLHTDRALALAKMHQVQETLSAVGTADEHFAHSTPDNDPPFVYYNATRHSHFTGSALADLAILGRDPSEATTRLTATIAGCPEGFVRARAVCLTKLASLTMVTGDPLQAVTIGNEALEVAGRIRSRRAAEKLRELSRYAAAHQDLEEVAHLRQQIGTLLLPTDSP